MTLPAAASSAPSDSGPAGRCRLDSGRTALQFPNMLGEMAAAVQDNRALPTPGVEGLRDIQIFEAIVRAAETSAAVVV